MIVYACADLIFATKIRSTAESLGVTTRPARDAEALQKRLDQFDDGRANDAVSAVFLDLDLADQAIALVRQAKAHDAALPVVAFGSHVATEMLAAARQAGADAVLPRSAFTARLPSLLEQFKAR